MPTAASPGTRRLALGVGGSLQNRIAEASPSPSVNVGDGATIIMYSDRHACTVIEASEKRVTVQRDKAIRVDNNGMSDSQSYEFERNPDGAVETFTLRKNGRWVPIGQSSKNPGHSLALGYRDEHYDYSF